MKVAMVKYERLVNLGNYENEKIGCEVEVSEGESPQAALDAARRFVRRNVDDPERSHRLDQAQRIVEHPDEYTGAAVKEARELLASQAEAEAPIPF
jgi:hypothetical protein